VFPHLSLLVRVSLRARSGGARSTAAALGYKLIYIPESRLTSSNKGAGQMQREAIMRVLTISTRCICISSDYQSVARIVDVACGCLGE
jgi:hypothetical protein